MIIVKQIVKTGMGVWLVDYQIPAPCGCFYDRKSIFIKQENKPTQKEIEYEINNRK